MCPATCFAEIWKNVIFVLRFERYQHGRVDDSERAYIVTWLWWQGAAQVSYITGII